MTPPVVLRALRAAPLLLLALLTPLVAAAPSFTAAPAELALEPGDAALVRVRLDGREQRGGVFDLFTDGDGLLVEYPPEQQRTGILLLAGEVSLEWTPTVRARGDAAPGERNVTFRLIERPGPPDIRVYEATLLATVQAPPAEAAPAPAEDERAAPVSPDGRGAALLVGGSAALVGLAALFALARGWPGLATLYWRTRREALLEHPVRRAMMEHAHAQPGITPAQLQRALRLSDGQLEHHLRRLEVAGYLTRVPENGARRLYVAGEAPPALPPLDERVESALREGAGTAREVATRTGLTPQHARYYLEKLRARGRVRVLVRGLRRAYVLTGDR